MGKLLKRGSFSLSLLRPVPSLTDNEALLIYTLPYIFSVRAISWLVSDIILTGLERTPLKNFLHPIGLWACLWSENW